jgi:hypothetical protein
MRSVIVDAAFAAVETVQTDVLRCANSRSFLDEMRIAHALTITL